MPQGQPGKCAIASLMVGGVDIAKWTKGVRFHESICKPYITAEAFILDDEDFLNKLGLVGGESATIVGIADGGQTYAQSFILLNIKSESVSVAGRASGYTLEFITPEYVNDRKALVQQAFKSITGTGIIQRIHSQFLGTPLSIMMESAGLLFQKNSHVISSSKPFKAIDDIRRQLVFPGVSTGSSVYFRDRDGVKLAPVEYLFNTMSPQYYFEQKNTWGTSWTNIFDSYQAIIGATTTVDGKGSRSSIIEMAAAASQEFKVMDVFSNKRIFNQLAETLHGGRHNFLMVDSQKIPKENTRRTDRENLLRARVTNNLYMKVPIQGGLMCTVGQGVYARLLPALSDSQSFYESPAGGLMLVADIMHEFRNDDSQLSGTSTIRAVKLEAS